MSDIGLLMMDKPTADESDHRRYLVKKKCGSLMTLCKSCGWTEGLKKYAIPMASCKSVTTKGMIGSILFVLLVLLGMVAWGMFGQNWGPFVFVGCPLIAFGFWELDCVKKSVKFLLVALLLGLIAFAAVSLKFCGVITRGAFW